MDSTTFDRLTRLLSIARSRRSLGFGLGLAGALLGAETATAAPCPKGKKKCKKRCIPRKHCCTNANCKPKSTGRICRNGRCMCQPKGARPKPCQGRCLPRTACCRDAQCGPGRICRSGVCCTGPATLNAALGPGGPATIQLCPRTTYLGTFNIGRNVTILGAGPISSILNGGGNGPVVRIEAGVTQAVLSSLGITNGRSPAGGGIDNRGTLSVVNAAITGNAATGQNGQGGGIQNQNNATLTLTDTTLASNAAASIGGAIFNNQGGTVTLTRCRIATNSASFGGGIYSLFGRVELENCDVVGNTATSLGGGFYNNGTGSLIQLNNSRVAGNSVGSAGVGGGIYNTFGVIALQNGTIVGGAGTAANRARSGAGIHSTGSGATMTMRRSHVIGNIASGLFSVGGIEIVSFAQQPTMTASTAFDNSPCDCNFSNTSCENTTCP
jgi:hypothetical protein